MFSILDFYKMKQIIQYFLIVILLGVSQLYGQNDSLNKDKEPNEDSLILLEKEPVSLNINEVKKKIGYPEETVKKKIEGKVSIRLYIDKKGNYIKHKVLKSPHQLLTDAVELHLKDLKFSPGIQKGKPIPVWITVPFNFSLTGNYSTKGNNESNFKPVKVF